MTPTRITRGLSVVELLVGLAVGLLISAAAVTLLAAQWREHRAAGVELRLLQELRGAADLITRDLRRAGHWGDAAAALPTAPGASAPTNPYAALAPAAAASDAAGFGYSRDAAENHLLDANERFGYRLRRGVIELQLGAGNWQALTDAGSLQVTRFEITPRTQEWSLLEHCATNCPAGASCDARLRVRSLVVELAARALGEPGVERRLRSEVRVRNDELLGGCPD